MFNKIKQTVERNVFKTYYSQKLNQAIQCGDINKVREHLSNGGDLNTYGYDDEATGHQAAYPGFPMLVTAAFYGQTEIVRFLLQVGAYVDSRTPQLNTTAFMEAIRNGQLPTAQFLLQCGADLNAKDGYGDTALMFAAQLGRLDLVQFLLSVGADANLMNAQGCTALNMATQRGFSDIINELQSLPPYQSINQPGYSLAQSGFLAYQPSPSQQQIYASTPSNPGPTYCP